MRHTCYECGGDSVNHRSHYLMLLLGTLLRPLTLAASQTSRVAAPPRVKKKRGRSFADLLVTLGLGEYRDAPDDATVLFAHVLWEEASRRGITMREFRPFGRSTSSFTATFPGGAYFSFESIPLTLPYQGVWWIDDKAVSKKRLKKLGVPVSEGGSAFTLAGARRIFKHFTRPAVVKPREGSASRHTTMYITDERELEKAFALAKQISPFVMIEEELPGLIYRPTLIDGKLAATLRRDQPIVWGSGVHTVRELVAEENKHPARSGPYFSRIALDDTAAAELARQGLTFDSIPEQGLRVRLHPKINWAVGGTTTDVTDDVHPDNIELFERVARELKAPIVGLDIIMEDISRSHKEQRCGVIECNARPFFDNHHLPFNGKPRDVAGILWHLVEQDAAKVR